MKKKQWQGWGSGEQAVQHYLVQPRALAGGGDVRHISEFLRASGWRDRSKTGGPLVMDSPDRAIRVAYDPYTQPGGWTIRGRATAHHREWWAQFGQQTPVEAVAGLTDALARPRSAHAPNVWAPLVENNWSTASGKGHYTAISPDGAAWMQFRQSQGGEAIWWTGSRDEHGNGWTGAMSASTPMHLVQGFSTELASSEPVMRPLGHVPASTRIRTRSVSVLPSELAAWQQARITAARAATWARANAPRVRQRSATSRPRLTDSSRSR
ncbi:DUF317 domain-containing protein [Streptomyces sp. NPDC092952]|uniref:DUF317 domain-containing protein n=1 Tax=Streptomyces sp. NPDC092952 TaxID=3366018 RepID=UPI0037F7215E